MTGAPIIHVPGTRVPAVSARDSTPRLQQSCTIVVAGRIGDIHLACTLQQLHAPGRRERGAGPSMPSELQLRARTASSSLFEHIGNVQEDHSPGVLDGGVPDT